VNAVTHHAPLVITAGEPAGIGPDLCVQLAAASPEIPFIVIADKYLLQQRAAQIGIGLQVRDFSASPESVAQSNTLTVIHVPLVAECHAGVLNAANSEYVLATLRRAVRGCQTGEFSGMVTAPVHKGIINDAGINFTGHTEFLAEQTGTNQVVMMLVGGGMRVALATTHLALKDVPAAITASLLENVLHTIQHDFQRRFGIAQPRILVAGLNPHAGEGGLFGREEIDIIAPAIAAARSLGLDVSGPFAPDTVFMRARAQGGKPGEFDVVVAMYHDQGLIPVKYLGVEKGVNVTLGLPLVRTSPDHGTAFDIAGSGRADEASLLAAIRMARQLCGPEKS